MNITYNINDGHRLAIGYESDHNANTLTFEGFERTSPENAVYLKVDDPINKIIPLTDEYSVEVSRLLTSSAYTANGQLIELHENEGEYDFIRNSRVFKILVRDSVDNDTLDEVTDPQLDLAYQMLYQEYVTIKTAYDNGELKGEKGDKGDKGDTYTITQADYESIASLIVMSTTDDNNGNVTFTIGIGD